MKDKGTEFFIENDDRYYIGDKRIRPYISYKKEKSYCIYCSNIADSREHLPSRIFIDKLKSNEWNIVPSCKKCNNDYSIDEQLVACAIEYILAIIYFNGEIQRSKIKKTFEKRPMILEKIKLLCIIENEILKIDIILIEAIKRVAMKIAKGHLIYDCNYFLEDEAEIEIAFKFELDKKQLEEFNSPIISNNLPEIGSRMSSHMLFRDDGVVTIWNIIDENNYRYIISPEGVIRMVIREFLYIEILY